MCNNFTFRQPENLSFAQSTVATQKTRKEFFDKRSSLISEIKNYWCRYGGWHHKDTFLHSFIIEHTNVIL
jgi:hypothetical protein